MSADAAAVIEVLSKAKRPARALWITACDPSTKPSTETGQLHAAGGLLACVQLYPIQK